MNKHVGFNLSSIVALSAAIIFATALATSAEARSLPRSPGVADRGAAFAIANDDSAASDLAVSDRHFLTQALRNSEKEVTILRLAVQRGEDPQLRRMAERLIAEREKAQEELRRLARGYELPLPDEVGVGRSGSAQQLFSLSGSHFDRAWLEQVIDAQRRALELFRVSARDSRDNRIRAFAATKLPALQRNLSLLKSVLPSDGRLAQAARS